MKIGSFLKKAVSITEKKKLPKLDIGSLQDQLGGKFFDLLETTFAERQSDDQNSALSQADLDSMVSKYANQNMAIALASGLVPGPMGIFAAVPELVLTMKNQMSMIYDFSCGYDKESFLNKDLLLDIPIFALGGKTNLASAQNQANLMDSPTTFLQGKATDLGKGIIDRNLKKSLVKFIPVGGAVIMATWAKMSTNKIAKASKTFFDDTEHFEDVKKELPQSLENQLIIEKIKAMINLMEANGNIHEEELSFIAPVIANAPISDGQKAYLLSEAESLGSELGIQFNLFKAYPEESETMMMELCLLAKRDGHVHPEQKRYLQEISDKVAFDQSELEEILAMPV